jgi:ABC-type glycerol-3-phosphate transport system permease component
MHAHSRPSWRVARDSALASLLLTILGTVIFLAGSFSDRALSSALGLCLVFTVPASLTYSVCISRVRTGNLGVAIMLSIIGGSIVVIAAIAAAIAAAYANRCFELARCT